MNTSKINIIEILRKEPVLVISAILAVISAFMVHPDGSYASYIDYRTIVLLFCLMLVTAGLRKEGVFTSLGSGLLNKAGSLRSVFLLPILLCFFSAMIITNDVALITFVPFTLEMFIMAGMEDYLIPCIVLETIAANLGSMLTPLGNPQNLYLYSLSGMSLGTFIMLMLPYTVLALVLAVIISMVITSKNLKQGGSISRKQEISRFCVNRNILIYLILFVVCLLCVARVVSHWVLLPIVGGIVLAADREVLKRADYKLLLTFCFLFVFIGNMKRMDTVNNFLLHITAGNEIAVSVCASQLISNVPAAILLSGFTDKINAIIVGVNLGGLGTIIASMASLISFKLYGEYEKSNKGAYMIHFTIMNLIFLAALLALHGILVFLR